MAGYLRDAAVAPKLLAQFGRVIALDMLVNNFDRFPMIWANQGNANNVLIRVGADGEVVVTAIDQCVAQIKDEPHEDTNITEYLGRVAACLNEAAGPEPTGPCVTKVRDFLKRYCDGHDIGEEGCRQIQEGLLAAAVDVAGFSDFAELFEAAGRNLDSGGWPQARLVESVNIGFLDRIATHFADVLGDAGAFTF